jgi:di/tricarboxylate transporter
MVQMMEERIVFLTLCAALSLFVWGKPRYDIVAILVLVILVVFGIVPTEEAFLGFGHPAVITVAAVLVVSKALESSGLVNIIVKLMDGVGENVSLQIVVLSSLVALASAFMNNIGALAIMMPVAIQLARKHNYSPSSVLMPIAFASLLGGMNTLIGTPPNIIISTFRNAELGERYRMFDFGLVGGITTIAGVIFISLVGWRLLPRRNASKSEEDFFEIGNYLTEVRLPEESKLLRKTVMDINYSEDYDIKVLGLIRHKQRIHAPGMRFGLKEGDILMLECDTEDLEKFINDYKLELVGEEVIKEANEGDIEIDIMEGIIQEHSPLIGRTAASMGLRTRYSVNLLALARSDKTIRERIDHVEFQSGDVLLLQGKSSDMSETFQALGCYPLAKRGLRIGKPKRTVLALAIFFFSILAVIFELLTVDIAFTLAAVLMVISRVLPIRDLYTSIDWPVIVLLGAMIPVGEAFETSGAANSITEQLMLFGSEIPIYLQLGGILVVTMLLSGVINNAATVLLMAPIVLKIAASLELSADPFLMAVAIGGSAAFLTPIGHQSNTLVMSPGGYKFSDYIKLGLPLTILIVIVVIPLLLIFWPP